MERIALAAWLLVCTAGGAALAGPAPRQLSLDAVNGATFEAGGKKTPQLILKVQVLLDRQRFSPGVIDGRDGDNLRRAILAYRKAQGLRPSDKLDREMWAKLSEMADRPVLIEYEISEDDVKGPFTPDLPDKLEELAGLERLAYENPKELLAEKFHMDSDLLEALNPGKTFGNAGTVIVVADTASSGPVARPGKAAKLEVDKAAGTLRALAKDGTVLASYPASIGSDDKPAPTGTLTVRTVARNPTYTYNPAYKFEGVKSKEKFVVKPGPNNPVGTTWIDLSADSFGIHGTAAPEKVGKAASHGCVRLTNWDVDEVAGMVEKGIEVVFLEGD